MIAVTIYQNKDDLYSGFDCIGHAGYANSGKDIVCSAVSALVINTVNSIEMLTDNAYQTDSDKSSGMISFHCKEPVRAEADLLIKSLALGLQGIQDNFGNKYITLKFKEV